MLRSVYISARRPTASIPHRGVAFRTPPWIRSLHATCALRQDALSLKRTASQDVSIGSITTRRASRSSIDELLAHLKDRRITQDGGGSSKVGGQPLLSLFLTPAFAQHALDVDLPLRAWEKIRDGGESHKLQPGTVLNASVGVIDRVPLPSSHISKEGGDNDGHEGMVYYYQRHGPIFDADSVEMNTGWRLQEQGREQAKPGTLNFNLQLYNRRKGSSATKYSFQLPLAHTIFQTGRVSTLVATQYRADESGAMSQGGTQRNLQSLTLQLPFDGGIASLNTHFPLVPLTPPRLVRECMGNIISRVSKSRAWTSDSEKYQPASQELEEAVANYFETSGTEARPVSVYALLIPKDFIPDTGSKAVEELLTNTEALIKEQNRRIVHPTVRKLVGRGARLCKVLSGGGGWGKKAGLLSLDPDVSYDEAWEAATEEVVDKEVDPPFEAQARQEAFGQIAMEGSAIMFFIAPHDEHVSGEQSGISFTAEESQTAVFGHITLSIDTATALEETAGDAAGEVAVQHHPNHFGILSEGGMALALTTDASKASETVPTRTKVDVVGTRFSVLENPATRRRGPMDEIEYQRVKAKEFDEDGSRLTKHERMFRAGSLRERNPSRVRKMPSGPRDEPLETAEAGEKTSSSATLKEEEPADSHTMIARSRKDETAMEKYFESVSGNPTTEAINSSASVANAHSRKTSLWGLSEETDSRIATPPREARRERVRVSSKMAKKPTESTSSADRNTIPLPSPARRSDDKTEAFSEFEGMTLSEIWRNPTMRQDLLKALQSENRVSADTAKVTSGYQIKKHVAREQAQYESLAYGRSPEKIAARRSHDQAAKQRLANAFGPADDDGTSIGFDDYPDLQPIQRHIVEYLDTELSTRKRITNATANGGRKEDLREHEVYANPRAQKRTTTTDAQDTKVGPGGMVYDRDGRLKSLQSWIGGEKSVDSQKSAGIQIGQYKGLEPGTVKALAGIIKRARGFSTCATLRTVPRLGMEQSKLESADEKKQTEAGE